MERLFEAYLCHRFFNRFDINPEANGQPSCSLRHSLATRLVFLTLLKDPSREIPAQV